MSNDILEAIMNQQDAERIETKKKLEQLKEAIEIIKFYGDYEKKFMEYEKPLERGADHSWTKHGKKARDFLTKIKDCEKK